VDGDIEVDLRFLPRFEVLRPGAKIYYGVWSLRSKIKFLPRTKFLHRYEVLSWLWSFYSGMKFELRYEFCTQVWSLKSGMKFVLGYEIRTQVWGLYDMKNRRPLSLQKKHLAGANVSSCLYVRMYFGQDSFDVTWESRRTLFWRIVSVRLTRVARFFLVQTYQIGKKYNKWPQTIPDGHRLYQTAMKYSKLL
jgi:hypothetical protein